jgi:hypothetical protein
LKQIKLKLKFPVTNKEKTRATLQLIKVAIKYSNFEGKFLVFVTGQPKRALILIQVVKVEFFYFSNF